MAQKSVMRRVCDLEDGRDAHEVKLAIGDSVYNPDLCNECQEELLAALDPFLAQAAHSAAPVVRKRKVTPPRAVPKEVREWAKGEGIELPPKGRIRRDVEDKYLAAQA